MKENLKVNACKWISPVISALVGSILSSTFPKHQEERKNATHKESKAFHGNGIPVKFHVPLTLLWLVVILSSYEGKNAMYFHLFL